MGGCEFRFICVHHRIIQTGSQALLESSSMFDTCQCGESNAALARSWFTIHTTRMTFPVQTYAPDDCITLLSRLNRSVPVSAHKLTFSGVGQHDVYNIAAPFELDGRQVIAGRVESFWDIKHSEIVFFAEADVSSVWQPIPSAATFPGLQDPCIAFIDGETQFGRSSFSRHHGERQHWLADGILPGKFGGQS